jgi:hypothetical protein
MTQVLTRLRAIRRIEGFRLSPSVMRNGRIVRAAKSGVLGPWPHENRTSGAKTVTYFRSKFAKAYPGCTCEVLNKDGSTAHGNKLLNAVRKTYQRVNLESWPRLRADSDPAVMPVSSRSQFPVVI